MLSVTRLACFEAGGAALQACWRGASLVQLIQALQQLHLHARKHHAVVRTVASICMKCSWTNCMHQAGDTIVPKSL